MELLTKPFILGDSLQGEVFEGDVSAQQTNAFTVEFENDLGTTDYNLDVKGWNDETITWQTDSAVIRNLIQFYDLVKRTNGFDVKFFENVAYLSYLALISQAPTPAPDAPHVTIRMSGSGLMDFSISGATGVKWIMQDGTVYSQDNEVPSGGHK